MDRVILHADMNCFYAGVEMLHHPELRDVPMAVGGDPELRHGIVLTKNALAKKAGVKTGQALWEARQACPDIVFVPPHYDMYLHFSKLAHDIYGEYTDLVEGFGIDEAWLDITASTGLVGDGAAVAEELRERVKRELGVTISVGVSWNKIYAKFGSDYRKPDAVTVIDRENYKDIVWTAPVQDLLYVGRATTRKLVSRGILTIGELAEADPELLHSIFGKVGYILYAFANGLDETPVSPEDSVVPIKSIGNGTTAPRDLVNEQDVREVLYLLSESVAARLREADLAARTVEVSIRDTGLFSFQKQRKLPAATQISGEIAEAACALFRENYGWEVPVRSIGVRATDLTAASLPVQLDLFGEELCRDKRFRADRAVDEIRRRFGYQAVLRGLMYMDRHLSALDAKDDNIIHPHGYMERGNRTGVM